VSAGPVTAAPVGMSPKAMLAAGGAGGGVVGVRAPAARIDFRSLLREDAVAREPARLEGGTRGATAPAAPPPQPSPAATALAAGPRLDAMGTPTDGGSTRIPPARDDDALDPFARHHASLASPDALFSPPAAGVAPAPAALAASTPPADVPTARGAVSLEDLLPVLVRRAAYSGDGRRGTVRLELGAGRLAGSTLLVHAEGGRVRVHLDVPPGLDASGWQQRIEERLGARGIPTDSVEVT
jgi:hypothetical protein